MRQGSEYGVFLEKLLVLDTFEITFIPSSPIRTGCGQKWPHVFVSQFIELDVRDKKHVEHLLLCEEGRKEKPN